MNKVLVLAMTFVVSQQSLGQDLDCNKYSTVFKNQAYQSYALAKTANLDEYRKFLQQTDYSYLFKDKHLGQLYRSAAWYSEAEALNMTKINYDFLRLGIINNFKIQVLPVKGSYQSSYGDVCVMPIQAQYDFLDLHFDSKYDAILVRSPKTKKWRVFIYLGIEKKQDMAEFFPDFPADIRLSAASYNGKNYAESSYFNVHHYYEFYHLDMDKAFRQRMERIKQENLDALKENGFLNSDKN
ncbi:hypothetical protein RFH42_04055 [Acinetobacter rudis]|uniref:hypothetical protein n=1 Tax=Acinetobacter rudis TaxID=632955 RepID=UPI00280E3339|nr:hypothetical protein [Acinetobacter rudis]MDQ8952128.1 hypothetical protein [Acinetobacter rudis]